VYKLFSWTLFLYIHELTTKNAIKYIHLIYVYPNRDPMKKYQAEKVLEECGMIHLHHLFDDDIIQEVKQSIMSYLCTYQKSHV